METNTNLKRRRDSGEGATKKICPEQPKAGPSSQLQKQQPPPPSPLPPPPFPSNITTHTNPSPNCHPLTPARTILQKMPLPLSNPSPKVTIS